MRDTGIGIPAEELPKLFDRFHRVEGAQGRSFEGSGIGLALVQELVKLHGGDIAVGERGGRGTAFTSRSRSGRPMSPANASRRPPTDAAARDPRAILRRGGAALAARRTPRRDAAGRGAALTECAASPAQGRRERRRVLLADDNADLRDYIARLLGDDGYEVEAAPDGEAALARCARSRPDLLVTDVMMPRLDGFGLLRGRARRMPALRDLPVIMLSARAGEEAKVEGLDAGADDYLTKPFSARELLARVAANIAHGQAAARGGRGHRRQRGGGARAGRAGATGAGRRRHHRHLGVECRRRIISPATSGSPAPSALIRSGAEPASR